MTGQPFISPESGADFARRRAEGGDQSYWFIPGLLHRKLSVIYGLPTGGKSTWTYNLVDAYLRGHGEFMGQPVDAPAPGRVAFLTTDIDGADDAHDAMVQLGHSDHGLFEFGRSMVHYGYDDWRASGGALHDAGYRLVVVDNASGLLGDEDSTNADPSARSAISRVTALIDSGLTAVLLTHANNNGTFGGAVEWRKASRCIYGIHGSAPSATRTVKTMNNKMNLPPFNVALASDKAPRLVRVTAEATQATTQRQDRSRSLTQQDEHLALMTSRDDWASQREAAEAMGVSASTVSRILKRAGYEFRDGEFVPVQRWAAPGEAA